MDDGSVYLRARSQRRGWGALTNAADIALSRCRAPVVARLDWLSPAHSGPVPQGTAIRLVLSARLRQAKAIRATASSSQTDPVSSSIYKNKPISGLTCVSREKGPTQG